jgi:hypothetical protein
MQRTEVWPGVQDAIPTESAHPLAQPTWGFYLSTAGLSDAVRDETISAASYDHSRER